MISIDTDSGTAQSHSAEPTEGDEAVAPVFDKMLAEAVQTAHTALVEDVGRADHIGAHVGYTAEPSTSGFALTHRFAATLPGYRGWHWASTIARAEDSTDITVCESVLLPGDGAITVPQWLPWSERVRAEDMHPGDLMLSDPDDDRLAPAYLLSDDPEVAEVSLELGLGRVRVMSREGRLETADRWSEGTYGSDSAMAKHAPAHCGTCGFYLPLAGSLRAAFGACGNALSPADGAVVIVEFGCGAHSEATISEAPEAVVAQSSVYNTADFDIVDAARIAPVAADLSATEAEAEADAEAGAGDSADTAADEVAEDDAPLVESVALDSVVEGAPELDVVVDEKS